MKIRIVSDSACNMYELPGMDFVSVPMKVIAGEKEYVDTPELDVLKMMEELSSFRGKSNTAHPGVDDWRKAFGDADAVYGVTVTGKLSGSYNSASFAAETYMEDNPGRQVYILDSRSTGPQMQLMLEKYRELIEAGKSFEEIRAYMRRYLKSTHCWWFMETLRNFVNTGRINAAVATVIKVLGINIVGNVNEEGELVPQHKIKGTAKTLRQCYSGMIDDGYKGGKVRIHHSYNEDAALELVQLIRADYPEADVKLALNRGLCGYYVEKGGMEIGYECAR